jgi:hypothetical protein
MQPIAPTTELLPEPVAQPRRPLRRWREGTVVLVLLLPLIVFGRVALVRSTVYLADVQHYFYPYHVLGARMVAQGELPLWNPYAFSGLPLLGDGQTGLLYPPNWLFLILPSVVALNYAVLLQFCIAGLGMYLLMRSLDLGRLPAFVAAVAYMFGGCMTARVVHLSIMSGVALLPLLFACAERMLRTNARRWFVAAAAVVTLQCLTGHPQAPVYSALALGLYMLVRMVERRFDAGGWRRAVLPLLQLAGIYALGFALAAIQLVPWFELVGGSPRAAAADFDFVFLQSTHGGDWLLFVFPYLYGALDPGVYAAHAMDSATAIRTWEHSAYVGIVPLALALLALRDLARLPRRRPAAGETPSGRAAEAARPGKQAAGRPLVAGPVVDDRARWFALCSFALVLLLGLLLAAGKYTPFAGLIYAVPLLGKLRDVERALMLVAFALTALAAFGLQRLIERGAPGQPSLRRPLLLIAALVALVPPALVLLARLPALQSLLGLAPAELEYLRLDRPNAYVPLLFAFASAALLAWRGVRPGGALVPALLAALTLIDVAGYAVLFNPLIDPEPFRSEPQVVAFLHQDATLFRKATFFTRETHFPADKLAAQRIAQEELIESWGMVYGIADINGFNSLQPRRYTDYLFGPEQSDVSYGYLSNEQLLQPQSPVLSMLNVKYLLVPAGIQPQIGSSFRPVYANDAVRVYENTQVYPRAFFVDAVRAASDARAVLRSVTSAGFDGRAVALVEAPPPPALLSSTNAADAVVVVRSQPTQSVLTTSTAGPRFLVLSEMYFPGWRAYVDGDPTSIYRTDYVFRGIVVPAGQHTITFVYRPASALVGAAISALALLVIAGLLVRRRVRWAA